MRSGLTTVPLQSRPNASPFWIMLLLSSTAFGHGMIDADQTRSKKRSFATTFLSSLGRWCAKGAGEAMLRKHIFTGELESKRLGLLTQRVPRALRGSKGVPSAAEIDFDPRCKIHGRVRRRKADVGHVTGTIARRDVQAAAERDRQVCEVTTNAVALYVCFGRGSGGAGVLVAEG